MNANIKITRTQLVMEKDPLPDISPTIPLNRTYTYTHILNNIEPKVNFSK